MERRWKREDGKRKETRESKEPGKRNKTGKRKRRRAFVVFAVHESPSDPIMTGAALPLSPTANLRLHVSNTHRAHTHKHGHTGFFSAMFVRTFCEECFRIRKCQGSGFS